ncbi:hypothetical protein LBMAG42_54900 [Deltaproteobacteria bacterium]|nr:hypothetical protein LBMAG42_54900 [Deltaproteobacteria bacterium]
MSPCPRCGAERSVVGLCLVCGSGDLAAAGGQLDRALDRDLDDMLTDRALAAADQTSSLMLDLDRATRLPSLAMLDAPGAPSALDEEVSRMLDRTDQMISDLDLGRLTALAGTGDEFRKIMRTGLVLLGRGRQKEGLEWWRLHRAQALPGSSDELVLWLLEAFGCAICEDGEGERRARAQVQLLLADRR